MKNLKNFLKLLNSFQINYILIHYTISFQTTTFLSPFAFFNKHYFLSKFKRNRIRFSEVLRGGVFESVKSMVFLGPNWFCTPLPLMKKSVSPPQLLVELLNTPLTVLHYICCTVMNNIFFYRISLRIV